MYDMYEKKPAIKHYVIVDNIKKLRKLAAQLETLEEWAFDTETNTLKVYGYNKDFKCVGISISWGDYNNYYIPLGHIREEDWDRQLSLKQVVRYLRRPFEREDVRLIGHNIKFDMHVMARIGINIKTQDLYDTMIASWLCDENSPNGLKENSMKKLDVQQEHFGEVTKTVTSDIKKQYGLKASNKATFDMVLIDDAAPYALDDAFYTWCLYVGSMDELEEEGMTKIFNKTYVKFIRTLFNMEERGVQVDFEHLKQMEHDVAEDKEKLLYGVYELAGCEFNVNSNAQLVELLFGYQKPIADPRDSSTFRKLTEKEQQKKIKDYDKKVATAAESVTLKYSFNFKPISKTASGAPQVNAKTLIKLSKQSFKAKRKNEGVELCRLLLQYKKLEKLSTAFLDGLEVQLYDDGKAHPSFNIIGCVAPDTLIPTSSGLVPIQDLYKADLESGVAQPFETIICNADLLPERTKYLVKFSDASTVKIETALGLTLEASDVHPLKCYKYHRGEHSHLYKENIRNPDYRVWRKMMDIHVGDKVLLPVGYNMFSEKYVDLTDKWDSLTKEHFRADARASTMPLIVTEDLAEFIGMYYADGSIHDSNGTFSVRLTNNSAEAQNRFKSLCKSLFGVTPYLSETCEMNLVAKSLMYIEQLYDLRRGCVNKVIPDYILRSPKSVIQAFIRGMTLDSCLVQEQNKTYLKFTVSNEISAKYLQEILLNMGIVASRRQDRHKTDNVYLVAIYNNDYKKFCDEIGFIESRKCVEIDHIDCNRHNYTVIDEHYIWVTVKSCTWGISDVYDFNVPNTHSFISCPFISHNTDSGRLSCSSPNLQQLPKADEEDKYQIRSLFVGSEFVALEDGEWVSDDLDDCIDGCHIERKKIIAGDYNNLEMRVLAHYCVQRNMPIALADSNSSMEIGRIVQKCDPVSVKAYNFDTGKVESKKVTNFWKNGQSNLYDKPPYRGSFKDWLRITVDWGNDRLVVTPNHEIYTLNGKVPASNLKVGDTLFYNCPCIENDLVDLIVGMSLGDSNFRKETDSMVFYHTEAQKDYFMWKRELLSNFISPHIQKSGDISKSVIGAHPFIHELKEHFKFAKRKHKCVKESLADLVTIKSLAIWYLDDGCISHDDRCSEEKGYTACICRENIGDGFIARLNEKFAGHGFTFNHILKGLTCSGEKAINFYKAIAPYCPKCMSYKFPFFLRDLVGIYTWNTEHRDVTEVKIQSIEPVKLGDPLFKKSLTQSGYDLEVEDLHNYFANNILVSNSKDHNLLEMFETGSDTHSSTAVNMFELDCDISEVKKKYPHLRQAAKVINFLDQTLKIA